MPNFRSREAAIVVGMAAGSLLGATTYAVVHDHDDPPPKVETIDIEFQDELGESTFWTCQLMDDGYEPRIDKCVEKADGR